MVWFIAWHHAVTDQNTRIGCIPRFSELNTGPLLLWYDTWHQGVQFRGLLYLLPLLHIHCWSCCAEALSHPANRRMCNIRQVWLKFMESCITGGGWCSNWVPLQSDWGTKDTTHACVLWRRLSHQVCCFMSIFWRDMSGVSPYDICTLWDVERKVVQNKEVMLHTLSCSISLTKGILRASLATILCYTGLPNTCTATHERIWSQLPCAGMCRKTWHDKQHPSLEFILL